MKSLRSQCNIETNARQVNRFYTVTPARDPLLHVFGTDIQCQFYSSELGKHHFLSGINYMFFSIFNKTISPSIQLFSLAILRFLNYFLSTGEYHDPRIRSWKIGSGSGCGSGYAFKNSSKHNLCAIFLPKLNISDT